VSLRRSIAGIWRPRVLIILTREHNKTHAENWPIFIHFPFSFSLSLRDIHAHFFSLSLSLFFFFFSHVTQYTAMTRRRHREMLKRLSGRSGRFRERKELKVFAHWLQDAPNEERIHKTRKTRQSCQLGNRMEYGVTFNANIDLRWDQGSCYNSLHYVDVQDSNLCQSTAIAIMRVYRHDWARWSLSHALSNIRKSDDHTRGDRFPIFDEAQMKSERVLLTEPAICIHNATYNNTRTHTISVA
jgi:hypothetical protein